MAGIMAAVQLVAKELNPDPVYVNTEPLVPVGGVTKMLAVTLNAAQAGISFTGVPLTVMLYGMFVVAYGPTTKLPCAVCGDVIEQVEDAIRVLLGVPGAGTEL
jgi:hypothetical protein